jgi:hypothetical protein
MLHGSILKAKEQIQSCCAPVPVYLSLPSNPCLLAQAQSSLCADATLRVSLFYSPEPKSLSRSRSLLHENLHRSWSVQSYNVLAIPCRCTHTQHSFLWKYTCLYTIFQALPSAYKQANQQRCVMWEYWLPITRARSGAQVSAGCHPALIRWGGNESRPGFPRRRRQLTSYPQA